MAKPTGAAVGGQSSAAAAAAANGGASVSVEAVAIAPAAAPWETTKKHLPKRDSAGHRGTQGDWKLNGGLFHRPPEPGVNGSAVTVESHCLQPVFVWAPTMFHRRTCAIACGQRSGKRRRRTRAKPRKRTSGSARNEIRIEPGVPQAPPLAPQASSWVKCAVLGGWWPNESSSFGAVSRVFPVNYGRRLSNIPIYGKPK